MSDFRVSVDVMSYGTWIPVTNFMLADAVAMRAGFYLTHHTLLTHPSPTRRDPGAFYAYSGPMAPSPTAFVEVAHSRDPKGLPAGRYRILRLNPDDGSR